jgi:hypothetical protein
MDSHIRTTGSPKRYQNIIRDVSPDPNADHAIVIYLDVEDAGNRTTSI